ncbi:MAG: calcium-binding protein, partial [Burkholderiales bacterium]
MRKKTISKAKLDELIEEATIDAYGESEQRVGFYTMIEENLALPFRTQVLGVEATVTRIDLNDAEEIVAICTRGRSRQT